MFWRRKSEFDDLEARLRAGRPEPREELVQALSAAARERPPRSHWVLRVGVAVALTVALVVTLAALGAASRSAAAATDVVRFVQTGSFSSSSSVIHDTKTGTGEPVLTSQSASSAEDQYEEQVTICHRTSALDPGNTLRLSPSGAANHLKNHRFDYAGPCHS
jgi:hypothetical protein